MDDAFQNGLPPVVGANPRVLIIGTLPGLESIKLGRYYWYCRNRFWNIMDAICGAGWDIAYEERKQRLQDAGIALWDVCKSCNRKGSADSSIKSEEANDIAGFLQQNPSITLIVCNGQKAARLLHRHFPKLPDGIRVETLISTSPAAAMVSPDEKRKRWEAILRPALD